MRNTVVALDLPAAPTLGLDFNDNTDANPNNAAGEAPAVGVKFGGAFIADRRVGPDFLRTADGFADVIVRLTPDGLMDVAWNGTVLFYRLPVPGFSSLSGARFGLYARTGGLNDNHWVDNLRLFTYLTADVLRITTPPQPQTVLVGRPAPFGVEVNLPAQASYQWLRDSVPITGATQATFTLASTTLADNGAQFSVRIVGAGTTLVSDAVGLRVLDLAPPTNPLLSYDFNDGQVPAGADIAGTYPEGATPVAFVDTSGGVNNSGVLKLTVNENGQSGAFRSPVVGGGAQLLDFTLAVDVLAGGGTTPPADGFSLCLGSDLPVLAPGDPENGAGTGVIAAYDTYDNGGGEAPAIDVTYRGSLVATRHLPLSVLRTGDLFANLGVRLNRSGTLDLYYGTTAVFRGLPLPAFTPFATGRFGWGARTGGLNDHHWLDNVRISLNTQPAQSALAITRNALGTVTISWTGGGTLQAAATVLGPFQDVAGASNPYTTPLAEPSRFFRIRN